ncbi:MarR family winged helix-turn-helix transcriptional regulator [Umezawaea sp. NPDC059074]|uniref:MarR family winged helix-turn-helix transcriptional regulator n=1 Tax=Umezawaea sp. NPDC059074 TaxID=3346716 RepID=UPI0036A7D0DD
MTSARKASRKLTLLYDHVLAPAGLRSTQFSILAELNALSRFPPTMGRLADVLVLDRSSLGHSLRPLHREGLVAFEIHPTNGRSKIVALTELGRERYAYARELWESAQALYSSVIGVAEADDLRTRLQAIAHDRRLA